MFCPGRVRYQCGPDHLLEGLFLCCLSCGGSATCSAPLHRLEAECLREVAEALRSHHPRERVGPFDVAIGNGRLYVLGWQLGLALRMLRLLGRTDDGQASLRRRVYVQKERRQSRGDSLGSEK